MRTNRSPSGSFQSAIRHPPSAILWLALLLLAGCAIGPSYHRPAADIPQQFNYSSEPGSSNSLADLPWWEIFNDATLTNLIHIALTNNYDIAIAAARVEQARALAAQARSEFFPQAGYDVNGYRGKNAAGGAANSQGNGTTASSFEAALNASWEIDLWGRVRRLNEAARAQFFATEEARRGVRLSLIAEVAQDYFQLLELDAELEIARRTTNSYGASLTIFGQRLGGGVASKLETDRAEGALADVAAAVPDLEQRIRLQENQLKVLLGQGSGSIPRGAPLTAQTVPPSVPAGLPAALLERRPDIRQAEQLLRSANAQVGVTTGDFLPKIGLTALFGAVSPELSALTAPGSRLWSAGVDASGPLFQAGFLAGRYRQARAFWDEAKLQYEQTVLQAFHEVSGQLYTRQKYDEARLQQARSVAAYQDAVKVATERYRAGHAAYFEILDAEQQLFPDENALARTQLNQLLIIVRLYKSLGGGWNQPETSAPAK
ncbi:MAG: efflux transporter outer membrane subunit [Verrucomicrobiota bacterium]|jgi:multidrug efflux system outer membrane protein